MDLATSVGAGCWARCVKIKGARLAILRARIANFAPLILRMPRVSIRPEKACRVAAELVCRRGDSHVP